jgi:hypothetical protein
MCFTAVIGQYPPHIELIKGVIPAFDPLYGVCGFATRRSTDLSTVRASGLLVVC